LYRLSVSGLAIAPDNLTWTGVEAAVWNVGITANFSNGAAADVFRNGDRVTFGNAGPKTVVISGAVAPAAMEVNSASNYNFVGSGIATNELTVAGGGRVTLVNDGNELGAVNVLAGALVIAGTGNAPHAGPVHVAAGASLELVGPQAFAASSTLTGGGIIVGDLTMPGTIAPGEPAGSLSFADDLALASTSIVEIEIGGLVAGAGYDAIHVAGDASLGGTLLVNLVGGYVPTPGATFTVLTADGERTGAFASQLLPELGVGLLWHTTYAVREIVLSVSAAAAFAAGDFNEDGFVDGEDLAIWRAGLGIDSGATHGQGDADGDSAVTAADFLIWQRGLNNPGDLGVVAPIVPEPGTLAIGLAALGLLPRRRRAAGR
jgi:hypothetical protein